MGSARRGLGLASSGARGTDRSLRAVRAKVSVHAEGIAQAITSRWESRITEARIEANSIASKIEGVINQIHQ